MFISDKSGPRAPYFLKMQEALRRAGIVTPALVIDRDRLDANIARLKADLAPGMAYRIVAKSLPSLPLLRHIRAATGTDRVMTFNLPMLREIGAAMPEADQLLGKPLSPEAAQAFLADPQGAAPERVQWLIDSPARLRAYDEIARGAGLKLRIALELDVGLHRGGLSAGPALAEAIETIEKSDNLELSGLMGYEPHLPSVPEMFGWRARARAAAWQSYGEAQSQIAARLGPLDSLTLNGAGSPTYRLYRDTALINEVAAGSVLVKPTDFDTPLLAAHQPACFIATPVVKGPAPSPLPALERLEPLRRWLDPNQARRLFIHGGHWLAHPEDPPGLSYSNTFGRSSNQEMLTGGRKTDIAPGDFLFLRPSQSEAVFLQFGPLLVYAQGEIVGEWEALRISA